MRQLLIALVLCCLAATACRDYTCVDFATCPAPSTDPSTFSDSEAGAVTEGSKETKTPTPTVNDGESTFDVDTTIRLDSSIVPQRLPDAGSRDDCRSGDDANGSGETNNGCACVEDAVRPCAEGKYKGECATGEQHCQADGTWGACSITPALTDDCSKLGNDADCDGTPNSGCPCVDGTTQACGLARDVGICKRGTSECVDQAYQACVGAVEASTRDCASADDNDCDGTPDNELDDDCKCHPGAVESCETHPGLDRVGICKPGTRTCQVTSTGEASNWSECTGSVGPLTHDSCAVAGDDSDCNGKPNEGCSCTSVNQCNDNLQCTTDDCDSGTCKHTVQSGYCLIGGVCINHNSVDPSNPCRYCDATLNASAWTNVSAATACDDGLWCNGSDTCNGSGACSHEFPDGNRCSGTDLCDKRTCDEAVKSCYENSSHECRTTTETQCNLLNTCGSETQSKTTKQYCTGSSSGCTGSTVPGNWQKVGECGLDQRCGASGTCTNDLTCVAWCDAATDVCWNQTSVSVANWQQGDQYCKDGTWAGHTDWRLPTSAEWFRVYRGCANGQEGGSTVQSQCYLDSVFLWYNNCAECNANGGPDVEDDGCYWVSELEGPCSGYWTSDMPVAGSHMAVSPYNGSGDENPDNAGNRARCILQQ